MESKDTGHQQTELAALTAPHQLHESSYSSTGNQDDSPPGKVRDPLPFTPVTADIDQQFDGPGELLPSDLLLKYV